MKAQPAIHKITIYPIKSLDGVELQKAMISKGGCLLHDREYAIIDETGNFIKGKNNPLIHSLRSQIDFENETISLRYQKENKWNTFHLQDELKNLNAYLTHFFGKTASLHQNSEGRFLDMPDVSGITIVSSESIATVSGWYAGMETDELRKRFRATIEINGVPSFWEDHLFSKKEAAIEFTMGTVSIMGLSPRARCVVPSRNPDTGDVIHAFSKTFSNHRAASLPEWSNLKEYDHDYYLTVNCYIPETEIGKWIQVGDEIKIIGLVPLPNLASF